MQHILAAADDLLEGGSGLFHADLGSAGHFSLAQPVIKGFGIQTVGGIFLILVIGQSVYRSHQIHMLLLHVCRIHIAEGFCGNNELSHNTLRSPDSHGQIL